MAREFTWKPLGDSAMVYSWGEGISRATSAQVIAAYRALREARELQDHHMVDVVPAYNSLAVHLALGGHDLMELHHRVVALLERLPAGEPSSWQGDHPSVVLPVRYTGEDLPRVARFTGLTVREVVTAHHAGVYTVAMIGFRPHFPYLIGMDPRLETPRLDSPRRSVAAGSVGIAGIQTGVYPEESPGGWNIIGTTDPLLLHTLRPGHTVTFQEVGPSGGGV